LNSSFIAQNIVFESVSKISVLIPPKILYNSIALTTSVSLDSSVGSVWIISKTLKSILYHSQSGTIQSNFQFQFTIKISISVHVLSVILIVFAVPFLFTIFFIASQSEILYKIQELFGKIQALATIATQVQSSANWLQSSIASCGI
jgi:hypothetical protein